MVATRRFLLKKSHPTSETWQQETVVGDVATLHSLGLPAVVQRSVRWCRPTTRALVLGRAQDIKEIDTTRDIEIVRRNSGGGAVLVVPGEIIWFDIVIPVDDPLWRADVGRSFWWLGDVLVDTLTSLGFCAEAHKGAFLVSRLSKKVCFVGLGPGEVTVEGAKGVGISQKRTKQGAIFQCCLFSEHRPAEVASFFRLGQAEQAELLTALEGGIATFQALDEESFAAALVPRLPVDNLR